MFGLMYNHNSFMNCFAPRFNIAPQQFFMAMPYMTPCIPNFGIPINQVPIFQNYFMPNNFAYRYYAPPNFAIRQTTPSYAPVQRRQNTTANTQLIHGVRYNQRKGKALAAKVVDILPTDRDHDNPLCAKYVKLAVEQSGLGPYVLGDADACKNIFRANPNFKEVNVNAKELSSLPAGCIIVYKAHDRVKNKAGEEYNLQEHGHTLITLGNGKGCSDIMEDEIIQSDNAYVFVPV